MNEKRVDPDAAHGLQAWIRERFPPLVTFPLAAILALSGCVDHPAGPGRLAARVVHAWLVLLVLRIVDDLYDLEKDRIWHPRRTLSRGKVTSRRLGRLAGACVLAAAVLELASDRSGQTAILAGIYIPFFVFKARIAPLVQPFWINLVFGLLIIGGRFTSPGLLCLGAFGWLAATGHDFCHGIGDMVEQSNAPAEKLRLAAGIGIVCYGAAFAMAFVSLLIHPDWIMTLALSLSGIWLAAWLRRLWRNPVKTTARALYVRGFLAFIMPLAARMVGFLG